MKLADFIKVPVENFYNYDPTPAAPPSDYPYIVNEGDRLFVVEKPPASYWNALRPVEVPRLPAAAITAEYSLVPSDHSEMRSFLSALAVANLHPERLAKFPKVRIPMFLEDLTTFAFEVPSEFTFGDLTPGEIVTFKSTWGGPPVGTTTIGCDFIPYIDEVEGPDFDFSRLILGFAMPGASAKRVVYPGLASAGKLENGMDSMNHFHFGYITARIKQHERHGVQVTCDPDGLLF